MNNVLPIHSIVSVVLPVLLCLACATGPVEIDASSYQSVPLLEADVMPSLEEVKRDKPRVAILPLELMRGQASLSRTESNSMEPALRSVLEASLLESDKVTLTDRNLALRLQGALAEYERVKGKTPKPFQQADYLIISQIDLANSGSEYKAATVTQKGRTLPGICITRGEVSGVIKIYDILENDIKGIKEISGQDRDVTEGPACAAMNDKQQRQLYQNATRDAVEDARVFFREFFAPRGYISEKRSNGRVWTFKVSTSGEAMSEYKTVKVYERRLTQNRLTNEFESE